MKKYFLVNEVEHYEFDCLHYFTEHSKKKKGVNR